jgi:hypothetical protein
MTRMLTTLGLLIAWTSAGAAQAPPPVDCAPDGDVLFACGLAAPEDLVVVPGEQWVIASAYAGRGGLYLIRASDRTSILAYPSEGAVERLDTATYAACPGAPDDAFKAKLQTHGLYLEPGPDGLHRLYVVVHGARESVEVFEVDARRDTPALTWVGCVIAPDPIGLNSVRALPGGGFIATNFLPRTGDPGGMKRMMGGEQNGELWEWQPSTGWQQVPGSEAAGANGLEISPDERWLYVAAWGTQSFFRLSRGRTPPIREEVPLGFRVDNIRWSRDGSILAAGQAAQTTLVVKIDPESLAVREIVRYRDTPQYGAGTVAVEVGDQIWVGSYRGDRLAVFPAPAR